MDLCKFTESLWKIYTLSNDNDEIQGLIHSLRDDVVVIGTGRLEFYENCRQFANSYLEEGPEREEIQFAIAGFWCKEQKISGDVSLVYGKIHVRGTGKVSNVVVDMDTRFSMTYHLENGEWKITHIHQSLPYSEQKDGEFYPKSLMEQIHQEKQRADRMERLARIDRLTGILNHQSFFEDAQELLNTHRTAHCAVADVDNFKQTNDQYGHQTGDFVLQTVGAILRECTGPDGVVGRVGGDEFAFLYPDATDAEMAQIAECIRTRLQFYQESSSFAFPNLSIGITPVRPEESLHKAFGRADRILYDIKRDGKSQYRVE